MQVNSLKLTSKNKIKISQNREFQKPIDKLTGFEVTDHFQRFDQMNDMFNRSVWDARICSEKVKAFFESFTTQLCNFRQIAGFTQKDYALRNASWLLADYLAELKEETEDRREGFLDHYTIPIAGTNRKRDIPSPAEMSREIKHVARLFGADLTGICEFDARWVYRRRYSRRKKQPKEMDLPENLTRVIVLAFEMDYELMRTNPSALSGAATGLRYSRDIGTLLLLAQYIRNLGYQAVASVNDTALDIPLAIQAGLGEYGRLGLLITREFGPRVRLGKIFTDLPLALDTPIKFGVREFCAVCRQCVRGCPMRAVPEGAPTAEGPNRSNIRGVKKWHIDAEKCFTLWVNQNTECSICIRVCPFNKDFSKWHLRWGRRLAGTFLRKWLLRLDRLLGYGQRKTPVWWWQLGKEKSK